MITIPLTDIKAKIKEQKGISDDEINTKIKAKLDQLSGLISEEGAAHIIANELGVKLVAQPEKGGKIQIKNVLAGMRNVSVLGKVTTKYEVREFQTEKRSGKVASLMLSDETGIIRLVLWNDQTDEFAKINEGDVLTIENAYARDNNGRKELHINDNSKIEVNPKGVEVKEVKETIVRKKLSELAEGDDNVEVLATIVQVFDPRFFEIDPDSGRRVIQKEGKWYLGDKEVSQITYGYVLNLFLDDGTENLRTVLWKNQIQKLLGKTDEEVLKYRETPADFESLKTELLGTIVRVVGRTNKNQNFDRLELVANLIYKDVNPEEEIKKLKETPTETKTDIHATPTTEASTKPSVEEKVVKEVSTTKEPETTTTPNTDSAPKKAQSEPVAVEEEKIELTSETEEKSEAKEDVMSIDDLEEIET